MEKKPSLIMTAQIGDVGVVNFLTSQVLDEMNVQQLGQELNDLVDKKLRELGTKIRDFEGAAEEGDKEEKKKKRKGKGDAVR